MSKNIDTEEIEKLCFQYLHQQNINSLLSDASKKDIHRFDLDLNKIRETNPRLAEYIIKYPQKLIPILERQINSIYSELRGEKVANREKTIFEKKSEVIHINITGMLGENLVSPRGLNAELTNQFVGVQGIVTRISVVRPKLIQSCHYCENTKNGFIKEYDDPMTIQETNNRMNAALGTNANGYNTNAIPMRDLNHNPLTFEYGFSKFKDHQTIQIQEPPERTPIGQLPRSIEVILEDDLVDKVKPGDRIQVNGVFKCVTYKGAIANPSVRTVLIATGVQNIIKNENEDLTGEEIRKIKDLAGKKEIFNILANSVAPGIYGNQFIKKALILQLLGGKEKNLESGTHLRGDINILMIGDPSTAKSQFLRYMLNLAPNAINTTGKGSTGVGLTAAVVVDRDTGERHLEAGAMVLGDRGIVCIDEFDKMNEVDRVAIHEVMEQQTVTIAKAGIHVSLNARCSVLAAANPMYGQYITDISTSKNIGFPDSLLSRFDLCFVVLDEHNPELDRKISEKVINNHMYNVDPSKFGEDDDDKVIEPQINNATSKKRINIYEKYNPYLHGKDKKEILTRDFLRKYIRYAKAKINPELTKTSSDFISKSWMKLREKSMGDEWKGKIIPITVRSLESLIRLSTAFAKARLSQKVEKIDCIEALELLTQSLFNETDEKEEQEEGLNDNNNGNDEMEIEEEKTSKKKGKKRDKKNLDNSVKNSEIRSEEITSEVGSVKKKNDNELFDDLINAQISSDNFVITEEHSNFVFKSIFEKMTKAKNQFITVDEIWDYIKDKKEAKSLRINSKNILYDISLKLEDEGKIFITEKKEIALV